MKTRREILHRCAMLGALTLAAGCHKEARPPASDPAFEREWAELAQSGAEPLFIEGELHGAGLMGEVRRAIDSPPGARFGEKPLAGALPDELVVKVIRQNLAAVKGCYQIEERAGTVGSGKAIVSLEIAPGGTVSSVKIDAPAFSRSGLPGCVSSRAKAWTFPKFTQGPKKFSYPFVFVGG